MCMCALVRHTQVINRKRRTTRIESLPRTIVNDLTFAHPSGGGDHLSRELQSLLRNEFEKRSIPIQGLS